MTALSSLYGDSLCLATDLYQLTMAYGYWKAGLAEREAVFHLFFRRNPFRGGYAVACGLEPAVEYLSGFGFRDGDLDYLAGIPGNDGAPLFDPAFLDYLRDVRPALTVDAVAEGTVMFPHEPLVRVRGPLLQCQIVETPLLNAINFQTLVATKAARMVQSARGEPVIDFGLRRAQGFDGGVSASRAAYIGGCAATSNLLAGKLYGIPVKGTHAHSWVMCFPDEMTSFRAYADAMPNNCVFLVDTYDTLDGVHRAVEVGRSLRAAGHEMVGVRLDSGDLAHLSVQARRILDDAGFADAAIIASNDLDEHIIASLKEQGAAIGVWGVGTKLVTGGDQAALGGVYKLSAIQDADGAWQHKVKLSENAIKISNPGIQQVRRYLRAGTMVGDVIWDEQAGLSGDEHSFDIDDPTRARAVPRHDERVDLLQPVIRDGALVGTLPPLAAVRANAAAQVARLNVRTRRLLNPEIYRVGLDRHLHDRKLRLIAAARGDDA